MSIFLDSFCWAGEGDLEGVNGSCSSFSLCFEGDDY